MANLDWLASKVKVGLKWNRVWAGATVNYEHNLDHPSRLNYATRQEWEILHGFQKGEWNAAVVRKIPSYVFEITVPASSSTVRALRALMTGKQQFELTVEDSEEEINVGSFELMKELFSKAYITTDSGEYTIEEVPVITFGGLAFQHDYEALDASEGITSVGTLGLAAGELSPSHGTTVATLGSGILNSKLGNALDLLFEDPWT